MSAWTFTTEDIQRFTRALPDPTGGVRFGQHWTALVRDRSVLR